MKGAKGSLAFLGMDFETKYLRAAKTRQDMLAKFSVVIRWLGPRKAPVIHKSSMSPKPSPSLFVKNLNSLAAPKGTRNPRRAPPRLLGKSTSKKLSFAKISQNGTSQMLQILGTVISTRSEMAQENRLVVKTKIKR